jgi:hypothetical protein
MGESAEDMRKSALFCNDLLKSANDFGMNTQNRFEHTASKDMALKNNYRKKIVEKMIILNEICLII